MSNLINFINFIDRVIENETLNASLEQSSSSHPTDNKFINELETFTMNDSHITIQKEVKKT